MSSGFFDPVSFSSMRNQSDYEWCVGKINERTPTFISPSQLFQPYYGWVVAEFIVTMMRAKWHPREPLVVYDVGAGTGNFALTFLDFLAQHYPDIYARCEYHLIDMNPVTIPQQQRRLVGHLPRVRLHNISILNWREVESRRCVVLALEVMSSMPHDFVTWIGDGTCYEQWMDFADMGNLSSASERFFPCTDPVILRYLRCLDWMHEESFHSLNVLCATGARENCDPPKFDMLDPELYDSTATMLHKVLAIHNVFRSSWVPSAQLLFLEVLARYFPLHHAVLGDWNAVQGSLGGFNGPIVQSKVRIAKDIYMRRASDTIGPNAGMVDITFPTDFEALAKVYRSVCGEHREVTRMTHPDFWKTFGGATTALMTTRSGWNPLLEDFRQYSIFASHFPS